MSLHVVVFVNLVVSEVSAVPICMSNYIEDKKKHAAIYIEFACAWRGRGQRGFMCWSASFQIITSKLITAWHSDLDISLICCVLSPGLLQPISSIDYVNIVLTKEKEKGIYIMDG